MVWFTMTHAGKETLEFMTEKKKQKYIKKITPIDV